MTGRWEPVSADLMFFRAASAVAHTGKVERSANASRSPTEGAPVAVATWACYRMPSGRTLGFPRCQPISVHAGIL